MVTLAEHLADHAYHGSGAELAPPAVLTVDVSTTGVLDVPGLTQTLTLAHLGKPLEVNWGGFTYNSTVLDATVFVDLYEDGAWVGRAGQSSAVVNGPKFQEGMRPRKLLTPGPHTWKVQLSAFNGIGVAHLLGNANYPAYLHVVEA